MSSTLAVEISVQPQLLVVGYPRTIFVYFYDQDGLSIDVTTPTFSLYLNGSDTPAQTGSLSHSAEGTYQFVPQGDAIGAIGEVLATITWTSHIIDSDVVYSRDTTFEIRGSEAFTVQQFKHSPLADTVEQLSFDTIRYAQDTAQLALEKACKGIAFTKARHSRTLTLGGQQRQIFLPWDLQEITALTITSFSDSSEQSPTVKTCTDEEITQLNSLGFDEYGCVSIPSQWLQTADAYYDDLTTDVEPMTSFTSSVKNQVKITYIHGFDNVPADVVQGLMQLTAYYGIHSVVSPNAQSIHDEGSSEQIFPSAGPAPGMWGNPDIDRVVQQYAMPPRFF